MLFYLGPVRIYFLLISCFGCAIGVIRLKTKEFAPGLLVPKLASEESENDIFSSVDAFLATYLKGKYKLFIPLLKINRPKE